MESLTRRPLGICTGDIGVLSELQDQLGFFREQSGRKKYLDIRKWGDIIMISGIIMAF